MGLDNDTRGWIMTAVSGVACVFGSSIICVDLMIQHIPGKQNFKIQDSNTFLSSSLSLSFGVMLFSSLYSMLPEAKSYLTDGGLAADAAAYATIGCFVGGVIGIQFVSRLLHQFIPSHVVDCDHSHDEDDGDGVYHHHDPNNQKQNGNATEETPLLLPQGESDLKSVVEPRSRSAAAEMGQRHDALDPATLRPSLQTRLTNRMSTFVSGANSSCDEGGPCYGYSEPCGQECFKAISRSPTRAPTRTPTRAFGRSLTSVKPLEGSSNPVFTRGREGNCGRAPSHLNTEVSHHDGDNGSATEEDGHASTSSESETANDPSHHHHVPTNAFLAIGLQTSIAIALHKLPEGFITYATNHANPKLGFTVFMALFIHNITEGFALALPLFLAINSRWKAIFWSSLLGGVSQPLGAGVAALWFRIAGNGDAAPGDVVYGCMFAITSGIMASVALQLFSESLSLTHNRNLCTAFAFIGMGILGISFALTAG
ncbi:Zinc/iron permease [Usnea florida]